MSDQPKARFTMPPGVRDVTAAVLGTLFTLIGAGRNRAGLTVPGQHGASPLRSGGEGAPGQPAEQQTHRWPRQRRRRAF